MKIAILSPYALDRPGGVQRVVEDLAARLTAGGEEPRVIDPVDLGARVRRVTANGSVVPLTFDLDVRAKLRRRLAGVDVVHVHEPLIPTLGWAGGWLPLPKVLTFHADPPGWARMLYRLLPRPPGVLTAVSPRAAGALPARWGPVRVIPNGVDLVRYSTDHPRRPRRVVFLGRDEPRKGLDVLLGAWPQVVEAVGDARLEVVGAHRSTPVDRVTFHGTVEESVKIEILQSSAVLVAPNLGGESFGIVGVEGLAAGCVVVASDLAVFREVLGDGAAYFTPGDPSALALTLIDILSDPGRFAALRTAGAGVVPVFDADRMTAAYLETYHQAVDQVRFESA